MTCHKRVLRNGGKPPLAPNHLGADFNTGGRPARLGDAKNGIDCTCGYNARFIWLNGAALVQRGQPLAMQALCGKGFASRFSFPLLENGDFILNRVRFTADITPNDSQR